MSTASKAATSIVEQHRRSKVLREQNAFSHADVVPPGQANLLSESTRLSPLSEAPLVSMPGARGGADDDAQITSSSSQESVASGTSTNKSHKPRQSSSDSDSPDAEEPTRSDEHMRDFCRFADRQASCFLNTSREGHGLVGRIMSIACRHGADFLFITGSASPKLDDILADSSVSLGFYDHSTTEWASVSGTALVHPSSDERIGQMWFAGMREWLKNDVVPGDDEIGLLEVKAQRIVHWTPRDSHEGGRLRQLDAEALRKAQAAGPKAMSPGWEGVQRCP